jgi:hypothetical protein
MNAPIKSLSNSLSTTPRSLRLYHDQARSELSRAVSAGGSIGAEAKQLSDLCLQHFEDEERFVFPVLGVLPTLPEGTLQKDVLQTLRFLDELHAHHDSAEKDHQLIQLGIHALMEACQLERNKDVGRFAYSLRLHERLEDEVIYPTVLLISEYLRERIQVVGVVDFPLDVNLPDRQNARPAFGARAS